MRKLPGLPPPPPNVDAATRQWMDAVSEALAVQVGQRGDPLDRAVTVRDLSDGGVAQVRSVGDQASVVASSDTDLGSDQTLPGTPVNFEAHANPRSVVLTWSKHQQVNIAHAEVYRSATDVLEDAEMVGVSPGQSYADTDIAANETWFYWLRYVSYAGNPGAWHSLTPVEVTVPELSGNEIADLNVDKLVGNTASFVEANIGEGSITNAMIGNEIRSDNFVPGRQGWRIHKDGKAEFSDALVRGHVEASTIDGGIIEGAVIISDTSASSEPAITTPTDADRGPRTVRYLTHAPPKQFLETNSACSVVSRSGDELRATLATTPLNVKPFDYTGDGDNGGYYRDFNRFKHKRARFRVDAAMPELNGRPIGCDSPSGARVARAYFAHRINIGGREYYTAIWTGDLGDGGGAPDKVHRYTKSYPWGTHNVETFVTNTERPRKVWLSNIMSWVDIEIDYSSDYAPITLQTDFRLIAYSAGFYPYLRYEHSLSAKAY